MSFKTETLNYLVDAISTAVELDGIYEIKIELDYKNPILMEMHAWNFLKVMKQETVSESCRQ